MCTQTNEATGWNFKFKMLHFTFRFHHMHFTFSSCYQVYYFTGKFLRNIYYQVFIGFTFGTVDFLYNYLGLTNC